MMLRAMFHVLLPGAKRRSAKTKSHTAPRAKRSALAIESLDAREMPAVIATFSGGILSVFGDFLDNRIDVSRDTAGTILVNGGAVTFHGATSTVANTTLIQVFGKGGN